MRTLNAFHLVWRDWGFTPEEYDYAEWQLASSSGTLIYPLRPELIESTYLMYRATGDRSWLWAGQAVLESLQRFTATTCGHAQVKNVATLELEDTMPSFFLAETTKYLFLLFQEDNFIHKDPWVFSTEAHPFKIPPRVPREPLDASDQEEEEGVEVGADGEARSTGTDWLADADGEVGGPTLHANSNKPTLEQRLQTEYQLYRQQKAAPGGGDGKGNGDDAADGQKEAAIGAEAQEDDMAARDGSEGHPGGEGEEETEKEEEEEEQEEEWIWDESAGVIEDISEDIWQVMKNMHAFADPLHDLTGSFSEESQGEGSGESSVSKPAPSRTGPPVGVLTLQCLRCCDSVPASSVGPALFPTRSRGLAEINTQRITSPFAFDPDFRDSLDDDKGKDDDEDDEEEEEEEDAKKRRGREQARQGEEGGRSGGMGGWLDG